MFVVLIGLADALYLTSQHYAGIIPPCYVTTGCETVLTSAWNKIVGIPCLSSWCNLLCSHLHTCNLFSHCKKEKALTVAAWATFIGLLDHFGLSVFNSLLSKASVFTVWYQPLLQAYFL